MRLLLVLLAITVSASSDAQTLELNTKNVVIVTLDGFRWRELFLGADERLLRADPDTTFSSRFGGSDKKERRGKLMPFFWNVIAREGQLYGNRQYGNKVNITNPNFYSYSGYSEMFVGFVDPAITDNTPKPNPNANVLHRINSHPTFAGEVAVFATWGVIAQVLRAEGSGIHVNTGTDKATGTRLTEKEHLLNFVVDSVSNSNGSRYDRFTFQYAMEYMKRERPRVLFVSLDETDHYAHSGKYGSYLAAANRADHLIGELWAWLQSQPDYKDQTTLIVGTDHGRGKSQRGWRHHRLLFRGSSQVWLAVMGPDTPSMGEVRERMQLKQTQVASTIGMFLSIPYTNVQPVGEPITSALRIPAEVQPERDGAVGAGN